MSMSPTLSKTFQKHDRNCFVCLIPARNILQTKKQDSINFRINWAGPRSAIGRAPDS